MEKLIYDPEARNEIRDAAAYYESCREGLGQAFLEPQKRAHSPQLAAGSFNQLKKRRIRSRKIPIDGVQSADDFDGVS